MTKRRALPILLGLLALLLTSATLPHLHAGAEAGLWNQEHDLALMATYGNHACQVEAVPVLGLAPAPASTSSPAPAHLTGTPLRLSDSRAPPLS